jgi:hypothetical protein
MKACALRSHRPPSDRICCEAFPNEQGFIDGVLHSAWELIEKMAGVNEIKACDLQHFQE